MFDLERLLGPPTLKRIPAVKVNVAGTLMTPLASVLAENERVPRFMEVCDRLESPDETRVK